jgi:hypothetical protein
LFGKYDSLQPIPTKMTMGFLLVKQKYDMILNGIHVQQDNLGILIKWVHNSQKDHLKDHQSRPTRRVTYFSLKKPTGCIARLS